eukprot:TRINITY_DN10226_c1_g1_i1.p1 TRINITY_DN10226_c1_g1~~TRINITY_DN10226_c1_g1_i1.p1  ORF type:complete len:827 (+),score=179.87 TRINITY_DN10226_c1_g1_i1:177-2657(+)
MAPKSALKKSFVSGIGKSTANPSTDNHTHSSVVMDEDSIELNISMPTKGMNVVPLLPKKHMLSQKQSTSKQESDYATLVQKARNSRPSDNDASLSKGTVQESQWIQESLQRAMQKGMLWKSTDAIHDEPTHKPAETKNPTSTDETDETEDNLSKPRMPSRQNTNSTSNDKSRETIQTKKPFERNPSANRLSSNRTAQNQQNSSQQKEKPKRKLPPSGPILQPQNETIPEEAIFAAKTVQDLGLKDELTNSIKTVLGIEKPTRIQQAAIPVILQGKDVLVKSETGTGKTLTYVIPMVNRLLNREVKVDRSEGTLALIIAPTRELGLQIYEVLQKILRPFIWIVPGLIMGGEKKKSEKARLRKGISILVATPGRLADHLETTESFLVNKLEMLVLDEADRLLDLGFEREVKKILQTIDQRKKTRIHRQNVLLSATLDDSVQRLADLSLDKPVLVSARGAGFVEEDVTKHAKKKQKVAHADEASDEYDSGSDEGDAQSSSKEGNMIGEDMTIPSRIEQFYTVVPCKRRFAALTGLILTKWEESQTCKLVVFLSNCDSVDFHYSLYEHLHTLDRRIELPDIRFFKLHGNMSQKDRTETYFAYIKSPNGVLLCTDVAARGLDLPNVHLIVQYDPPGDPKDYVHRVGRTARLNKSGSALLFLMPSEVGYVEILRGMGFQVGEQNSDDFYFPFKPAMRRDDLELAIAMFTRLCEDQLEREKDLTNMAHRAYTSYIRAYSTKCSAIKHIFHVKNLHVGHVAKSFGLTSTPTEISRMGQKKLKKEKRLEKQRKPSQSNKVSARKQSSSTRLAALKSGFGNSSGAGSQSRDMSIFD